MIAHSLVYLLSPPNFARINNLTMQVTFRILPKVSEGNV